MKKPRAGSASITEHLRRAILEGEFTYLSRLPGERDLAESFAASRGTVRTALNQLEEMGLVSRRIGSGTYVTHEASTNLLDSSGLSIIEVTSPVELIECRLAIEPKMVKLAVLNASNRDLENLRQILDQIEACGDDPECFSRADELFHLGLATASHNRLIYWLYMKLNEVRTHAQWDHMKKSILSPPTIKEYNRQHRALYGALVERNIDVAETIMTGHLEKARQDLLSASPG
ncbi:MAG: FadR family transcriptional regulator [Rhodospirillaceae bacterium]|nr:FadR family transcriptional regulator [Rhodospirillaceae bacterium]